MAHDISRLLSALRTNLVAQNFGSLLSQNIERLFARVEFTIAFLNSLSKKKETHMVSTADSSALLTKIEG